MPALRLAMAQLNLVVGDLAANVASLRNALSSAERQGVDLCLFPELAITGYPPEDLLMKPRFVSDNVAALHEVAAATSRCVAVVGFVDPVGAAAPRLLGDGGGSRPAYLANAAAICAGGAVVATYHKQLLPNYGVFDEQRWFIPGNGTDALYRIGGAAVGITICEDIWSSGGPVARLGRGGADLVVNINASPYSQGRWSERLTMVKERVAEAGCAIAYCNLVGGQDELVFDGASIVVDRDGRLLATARQFDEELVVLDVTFESANGSKHPLLPVVAVSEPVPARPALVQPTIRSPLPPAAEIYDALVLGTRDYLTKNGFSDVVVGLSGGIDSALVATLATDALGPEHVHALSMPSRYSSEGSVSDALEIAGRLGIDVRLVPLDPAHRVLSGLLTPVLGAEPAGLTDENLQSRLRGLLLMAVSNAKGWIVLTTGNKSEVATGYFTLYGDAVGGFAAIKDISKTQVYELCEYRNGRPGPPPIEPIPASVLEKPPSAELRPDQRDDQSLPPYDVLDPVLAAYVERDRTKPEMLEEGFDPLVIDAVVRLVDAAEYKRRQLPPGVRITAKAFGKDRRVPITNRYRAEAAALVTGSERGDDGP